MLSTSYRFKKFFFDCEIYHLFRKLHKITYSLTNYYKVKICVQSMAKVKNENSARIPEAS